jgi:SAM-dependent methyltransferase
VTSTERGRRKYDALADTYEELYFYVADVGQRLIDFADPPPGARVLDVGAGRGAVTRAAVARDCTVTAIDASAGMVTHLAADYPAATAVQMDAAPLSFPEASFDLVTAGFVIQILTNPGDALAEFRRVLTPGGTVALSLETQSPDDLPWLHTLAAEFFGGASGSAPTPLTHDRLDALLIDAGFTDLARDSVTIPLPIADPPALWSWLAPRGLADALTRLPPDRAAAFHTRFHAIAQDLHTDGGIQLTFAATLHRATHP